MAFISGSSSQRRNSHVNKMCIVELWLMRVLGGSQAYVYLFSFNILDLHSLPVEQILFQHLCLLTCHTDQPSSTHLCNTHFLSGMVFHLRLLDAEKALQSLQTSGAACAATWHHIPEQPKLKHF